MSWVYLLWHVRSDDEDGDDAKLIGVYSSEVSAREAVERKKKFVGFAEHPDGFSIDRYEIDHDAWSEGFISA